jgi:cyclase
MLIIPSIDIINGKCVRLTKGEFSTQKIYSSDPLAMAKKFEQQGARMLHIVDLDAAKTGKPENQELILKIAENLKIPIEVGGGIRINKTARAYLNSGVQKIVVGTRAITDLKFLSALIEEFGNNRIVVAVETKQGKIAVSGWQETIDENYIDFAAALKLRGVTEILFTDVDKDGSLAEPNFNAVKNLVELGFKVIASGGISGLESIRKLRRLGASSAILGTALYENKIALADAFRAAVSISNLTKRIIPCLDVKGGRVVKGIAFENLRDAGDPAALGKKYSEEGADELVFLDITASKDSRQTLFDLVAKVAKEVFIPFTVGGGIKTLEEIRKLLQLGADKISLNTTAVVNPSFISEAAEAFGQQCVVVAIDAKKKNGRYEVFIKGGTQATGLDVVEWAREAEKRDAGEILLTSMDKDGTKSGYDLELLRKVSETVKIPVIASGGAGSLEDLKLAFTEGRADAALVASLFHYGQLSVIDAKNYLSTKGIPIRI